MQILKIYNYPFLLICILTNSVFAQSSDQNKGLGIDFKDKPTIFFMYDRNYSFVESKLASTSGLKIGLEFSKKLKLGIGYSWLNNDVVEKKTVITDLGNDTSLNAKLTMRMGILYSEYIFYDKSNWQFSMPVQLGIGTSYFTYYESMGDLVEKKKLSQEGIGMLNVTGMATYRVLKWFGLSAGAGVRLMIVDNNNVDQNLNGPIFAFRIRIFFGEIYKSFFPKAGTKDLSSVR